MGNSVKFWERDDVRLLVPVVDLENGGLLDLTGATHEAYAQASGSVAYAATTFVAAAGKLGVTFPRDTFDSAIYELQIVVEKDGVRQTLKNPITLAIQKSITPPS